jgi:hypothetical protein
MLEWMKSLWRSIQGSRPRRPPANQGSMGDDTRSELLAPAVSTAAGMAAAHMTAADMTANAAIATATAADIYWTTTAIVTVAVAAVIVVAATADCAADHAGHQAANDRRRNSRVILMPIVDLLDEGIGPDRLRPDRVDRRGRGGRQADEQAGGGGCCDSNERHATFLCF